MTVGSVPKVAVTRDAGGRAVISRATGFSADLRADPAGPGWIRIDSVVPSSQLGQNSSPRTAPR